MGAGEIQPVRVDAEASGLRLRRAARAGDIAGALAALESHQVLLAHRRGPFGVSTWAARVESWLVAAEGSGAGRRHGGPWYPGRPLLVTVNDRDSGLFNGDTGVVVADQGESGVIAAFGDPHRPVLVRPHRLPSVETVHAMTVHRAQGSQFARVSVVLPPATSPLLTRELLYTALTRAREHVRGGDGGTVELGQRPGQPGSAQVEFGVVHIGQVGHEPVTAGATIRLRQQAMRADQAFTDAFAQLGRRGPAERDQQQFCLLYTSPSPRDGLLSRMPSSA